MRGLSQKNGHTDKNNNPAALGLPEPSCASAEWYMSIDGWIG